MTDIELYRPNLTPEEIIQRARNLADLAVPYVHQGNNLEGIDCVYALGYILQYDGFIPPYGQDPVNGELETELEARLGPPVLEVSRAAPLKDIRGLQPCDILSMQYFGPIRHVAFVVPHRTIKGQLSIVHTDMMVGRVTEHILDEKWLRRVVKVWRIV